MNELIQALAVYAIPVIFAITLHEAAHAYTANYFGDNTAVRLGRLSLNPIKHIDPVGTILIPIALYLISNGSFAFGYAKPVPVNFGALKNPKRDMAWVALAGPAANYVMAFIWLLFDFVLGYFQISEPFFIKMAKAGLMVNLVMFALNLFPMLPLDGGRILTSMLPIKWAMQFSKIERYGFIIVMALIAFKVLDYWLVPIMTLGMLSLKLLLSPLSFLIH